MLPDDIQPVMGINLADAEEPLEGRPQTVRLEKTDGQLSQSVVSLTVVTDYDASARTIERRVYRADGSLSFHESFQYEEDPPVCTIRILNGEGAIVSARRILTGPDGDESIVASASGKILEKTTTKRDSLSSWPGGGTRDSTGHEHDTSHAGRRTIVETTDARGNWTRKTTVEPDPATGDDVVVVSMTRTITYYPD